MPNSASHWKLAQWDGVERAQATSGFFQSSADRDTTLICSWCFCSYYFTSRSVPNQGPFFRGLGAKVKALRKKHGYSQEDMISFGFSARHWQQVESGRPITVTTLLRICEVFGIRMSRLVQGLDEKGVYELVEFESPIRRARHSQKK